MKKIIERIKKIYLFSKTKSIIFIYSYIQVGNRNNINPHIIIILIKKIKF